MKIELKRADTPVHFVGMGESTNVSVHIDGPQSIGGNGKGVRPMELVLMALGSCAALDLVSILEKQKQDLQDLSVSAEGKRREQVPNIFTDIHLIFTLTGKFDTVKADRAVELAVKKYCSVHDMLAAGGVDITYETVYLP